MLDLIEQARDKDTKRKLAGYRRSSSRCKMKGLGSVCFEEPLRKLDLIGSNSSIISEPVGAVGLRQDTGPIGWFLFRCYSRRPSHTRHYICASWLHDDPGLRCRPHAGFGFEGVDGVRNYMLIAKMEFCASSLKL